jgi:hypothetical protein
VFLAARTGAVLRWLLLAVLALRRTRRLAPHPVLFAKIHIYFRSSTWEFDKARIIPSVACFSAKLARRRSMRAQGPARGAHRMGPPTSGRKMKVKK